MSDYHQISILLIKKFQNDLEPGEQELLNQWIENSGINLSFFASLFENPDYESLMVDLQSKLMASRLS